MEANFDKSVFEKARKDLKLAEEKRVKRFNNLKKSVRYTFPLLCGLAWWVFAKFGLRWMVLPVVLYFGFYVFALMFNNSASKIDYKQIFLTPVLKAFFPHLTYKPLDYLRMNTFDKSNLFPGTYDNFFGDDLFTGTVEGRQIIFSDLEVTRHSRNSANWNHNTVIFKGILVNATLPEPCNGGFIVEPRPVSEPDRPAIVKIIRKFTPQRAEKPAKTGFKEFDDPFQLLTLDLGISMQCLTVKRMELITGLRRELNELNEKYTQNEPYSIEKPTDKLMVSLSVYHDQLYLGIRNLHLFDLPFDSDLTESEGLFNKSVELIGLIDRFVAIW